MTPLSLALAGFCPLLILCQMAFGQDRPRRLERPLMYRPCQGGQCYAPPPVTAYPVQGLAQQRVTPSPSGPHVVRTRAVYYFPVYYLYPRR